MSVNFLTPQPLAIATQPVASKPVNPYWQQLFMSKNGLILLFCCVAIAAFQLLGNRPKPKLATGRWAQDKDKKFARKKALKQMRERQKNAVTLYIGQPQVADPTRTADVKTLYLPDVQRGIAVMGAAGSGKTFSVIDPLVRSAVDQGFPLILYDFKYPTQTARLAGYAKLAGYKVRVFAPGFPESEVCNPLDFIRDETDGLMARQIATVINRNFKLMAGSQEDAFFGPAGDQLTQAILMLTKATKYQDIMMSQAILSMEDLETRLMAAPMNPWVRTAFGQFFSTAKSEKTASSIKGTASLMFTRFMNPGTLGAFCGPSSIPLDLKGKELVIFGMDRERRDVVGPLLVTCLHMIINRNVVQKRQDPLVVAIDEMPTLFLPSVVQWLAENREDGLCLILGWQNLGQLEKNYTKEVARTILGNTATKAIFNLQELESARSFSDYLGEEEIRTKEKSRSRNHGGKGGGSTSYSDREKTRKLFEASRFNKLPAGKSVIISPAYGNKKEAYVPLLEELKIPDRDLALQAASERAWDKLREWLIRRSHQVSPTAEMLDLRMKTAEEMFPIPEQNPPEDFLAPSRDKIAAML